MAEFDGRTYDPGLDHSRLTSQLNAVREFMWDERWYTQFVIALATGVPLSTVGSRIRDLRKEKFGGFNVRSFRVPNGNGLWLYSLRHGAIERTAVTE